MKRKLHLGCGTHLLEGYLNVDAGVIPGVDLVHDLREFPWPFDDRQFEEVIAVDVLEHLPDTIRTMEEIYRITKPEALLHVRVPYFNSWDAAFDPTHIRFFNENSFDFFDPHTEAGKTRLYYTDARFGIVTVGCLIYPFGRSLLLVDDRKLDSKISLPPPYDRPIIHSRVLKKIYIHGAHKLGNLIRALDVTLERLWD
jgi:SAM-dependent methyltransferase